MQPERDGGREGIVRFSVSEEACETITGELGGVVSDSVKEKKDQHRPFLCRTPHHGLT